MRWLLLISCIILSSVSIFGQGGFIRFYDPSDKAPSEITGNTKRLLRHCIYALLYHDDTTMMDLLIMLSGIGRNRNQKTLEFYPDEERLMNIGKQAPDPLTRRFFEYGWKEVDNRTVNAVIERIDGILSYPLVRRFVVGKNSFDLDSYMNTGKIVIVNLDFTILGNVGSEAIGRLIVSILPSDNVTEENEQMATETSGLSIDLDDTDF